MSRDMAHRLGVTPNENGMYQFGVTFAHAQCAAFVSAREDTGAVSVSVVSYDELVNPTQHQQLAFARCATGIDVSK